MTLVLGIVIAFLVFMMLNLKKENQTLQAKTVYVLNKDIQSGGEIKSSDLKSVKVSSTASPANAVSSSAFQQTNEDGTVSDKTIIAKIDLKTGTILTGTMLIEDERQLTDDVRKQEYNVVTLPMDLITGDFVDIRLLLPSGQDFIVVAKKKIEIPVIAGVDSSDTITMELTEDETLSMSNAIVEAFMVEGAKLYAAKYTDAGNQQAATPTYPVNGEVAQLVESDSNIVDRALNALRARYNRTMRESYINSTLNAQEDAAENEKTKMQESITKSKSSREEYLESLGGGAVTE